MTDARDTVLDAVAVYRLSRLIARDTFPPIAAAREWWFSKHPTVSQQIEADDIVVDATLGDMVVGRPIIDGKTARFQVQGIEGYTYYACGTSLGEVVECSWCNSVWIAAGVYIMRRKFPRFWAPFAWILSASAVAGFVAMYEQE